MWFGDATKVLNGTPFPNDSYRSSLVTLLRISSRSMTYPNRREDPVFPARHPFKSIYGSGYINNDTRPAIMGCIDSIEIFDDHNNLTWTLPHYSTPRAAFESVDKLAPFETELPLVLLYSALAGSTIYSALSGDAVRERYRYDFEASHRCTYRSCLDLPDDQWKIEVNRWFEASLARIQANVLDIMRGTGAYSDDDHEDYEGIPPHLRGICQMGKFRSVGWRNVSVWGFLGIILLVAAVTLASNESQDGTLWIQEGARRLFDVLWWTLRCA